MKIYEKLSTDKKLITITLSCIVLLSSCELVSLYEKPSYEIRINNPTDTPVEVQCSSFTSGDTKTIPAYTTNTYSILTSLDYTYLYANGRYFNFVSKKVYLDFGTSYQYYARLDPNRACIKLTNYTGRYISSASVSGNYFMYDQNYNSTSNSIAPNETRYLRKDNSYYSGSGKLNCIINGTFYDSYSNLTIPSNGYTNSYNLYFSDLTPRY